MTSNEAKYSFWKILPNGKYEFFVDASLLKNFSHCERYFFLHNVKNLRPKGYATAMPFPMAIGSWWSQVMELFYNFLRDKKEITMQDVTDFVVKGWHDCNLEACALAEPDKFESFGDIAGAALMLWDYHQSQYLIDKHHWKVVSVEEGFGLNKEVFLGETPRVVVYWVGRPDLTVVENDRLTPVDHKTVSRIDGRTITRYKPSSQMPGYVYSCEIIAKSLGYPVRCDRCVVNICSRSRPAEKPRSGGSKKPRFVRAYPNFSREEIDEWRRQVVIKCERIAHCLKTGEWTWSETSCDNFYNRPCDFKKLDSTTASARDIVMAADFVETLPWRPYKPEKEED